MHGGWVSCGSSTARSSRADRCDELAGGEEENGEDTPRFDGFDGDSEVSGNGCVVNCMNV